MRLLDSGPMKAVFVKHKFNLVLVGILISFFALHYLVSQKHFHAFNFGDESEHIEVGWEMVVFNKSLYTDVSVNHQPLPFINAFVFQKLTTANTLYRLIERAKQYVFILSFLGALGVTLRFGKKGFLASVIVETIKLYFFGGLLLAESLVVYPIIYIGAILFEHFQNRSRPRLSDDILIGLAFFWTFFNLLAMVPFLLFTCLVLIYFRRKRMVVSLAAMVIPTILLFRVIDVKSWYHESIYNVYTYFLPNEDSVKGLVPKIKILVYPVLNFWNLGNIIGRFYVTCLLVVGLAASQIKKTKRNIIKAGVLLGLLISTNVRISDLGVGYFTAFHLLPQVAFLAIITSGSLAQLVAARRGRKVYRGAAFLAIVLLMANSTHWWWESKDKLTDHFVNFGQSETIGMAINTLRRPGDELLAGPQKGYTNIVSGLPIYTRQSTYLPWAYNSPELRNEFESKLNSKPPTFMYFTRHDSPYYGPIKLVLDTKYTQIVRGDGNTTGLYMLNSEIGKRDDQSWLNLERLYYRRPSVEL